VACGVPGGVVMFYAKGGGQAISVLGSINEERKVFVKEKSTRKRSGSEISKGKSILFCQEAVSRGKWGQIKEGAQLHRVGLSGGGVLKTT